MATLRALSKTLRTAVVANGRKGCMRQLSTRPPTSGRSKLTIAVGTAALGVAGLGIYSYVNKPVVREAVQCVVKPQSVSAAAVPSSQPSVWSPGKKHALYLWIHLKPNANQKEVAKVAANLQKYVDQVVDPSMRDEDDEVLAGVGFGPTFYAQVKGQAPQNFVYPHRKGALGEMPSSGGDLFIHAKSNEPSKLYELCQLVMRSLPKDSVDSFEDIYSFVYRNGRDLSGFIDGTENRADDEGRQEVAVEKETGGSYVITQKWIHDMELISTEKRPIPSTSVDIKQTAVTVSPPSLGTSTSEGSIGHNTFPPDSLHARTMECWVGRSMEDSTEIKKKCISSHVARMTSGNAFEAHKPVEIVRQSMPFGTVSGDSGLFFIGYAASPKNFDYMLDRMVGAGGDGVSDDIMRLSKNVKGSYWYFPGSQDLATLA